MKLSSNPENDEASPVSQLIDSGKRTLKDKKFDGNGSELKFINYDFVRLVAVKKKFESCDFRYSVFDEGYLRNCHFEKCNFTGARFKNSNLISQVI